MATRRPLQFERNLIAGHSKCALQTIGKYFSGGRILSASRWRIEQAMKTLKLGDLIMEPSAVPARAPSQAGSNSNPG